MHEYGVKKLRSTHAFIQFVFKAMHHSISSPTCFRGKVTGSSDRGAGPDHPATSVLVNV